VPPALGFTCQNLVISNEGLIPHAREEQKKAKEKSTTFSLLSEKVEGNRMRHHPPSTK